MQIRSVVLIFACVIATAFNAAAQSKFSGKMECAKPDPNYVVPAGDRPNHAMSLSKGACTWTQGEVAGAQAKSHESVWTSEINGNTTRDHGYAVATFAGGDKTYSRFDSTTTLKDGAPISSQGTYTMTGGTGKLKGIKGKGTFKASYKPDGSHTLDVEGDYQLAPASSKTK